MRYRRVVFLFLFLCIFPALACNFPSGRQYSSDVSPNALRQTLDAQNTVPQPGSETPDTQGTVTPFPDSVSLPEAPSAQPTAEFDPLNYHYLTGPGDTLPSLA